MRTDQMESDRFDLDLKSRDAEIAKYRQALQVAKTNKEYSAILTQLNTHKADNSKLEEKVLGLMGQVDIRRKTLAGLNEQRAAEAGRLSELQAAAQAEEDRCRDRLSAAQADRDQAAAAVPPKALISSIAYRRRTTASPWPRSSAHTPSGPSTPATAATCRSTSSRSTPIMSRDEAITCNTCGRILYVVDMPTATKAS